MNYNRALFAGCSLAICFATIVGCGGKDDAGATSSSGSGGSSDSGVGSVPDSSMWEAPPLEDTLEAAAAEDTLRAALELMQQGKWSVAEKELRKVLKEFPDSVEIGMEARRNLARIMIAEGRRWDAKGLVFMAVATQQCNIKDLVLLGTPEEPFEDTESIELVRQVEPAFPVPLIGRAKIHRRFSRDREAVELLRQVVEFVPILSESQVQLGAALLELTDSPQEFINWHNAVPKHVERHPELWFVRGRWAEQNQQPRAAARCYWQAVDIDPDHRRACFELGRVLKSLERDQAADAFLERARLLAELEQTVHPIFFDGAKESKDGMVKAAQLTEELGRLWEALAWHQAIASTHPDLAESSEAARDRLEQIIARDSPEATAVSANPAELFNLSAFPLPRFGVGTVEATPAQTNVTFEFTDDASDVGVNFVYFDSAAAAKRPLRIFDTIGGGVAVLDYDADGWPDIYFTQGCPWPVDPANNEQRDRLYRNLGNGKFADVTDQAGLGDTGYSQGVAVGDIDNDGLPDLYVANIGRNVLYHNNGDGTFSRIAQELDKRGVWTTSCLIADLNGDGLPDIYDVNYLAGEDVFDRVCQRNGKPRVCAPREFDGEQDNLYLNQGDGTWLDVSEQAGVARLKGNGLGIVAADFARTGQLRLFVANDGVANSYLIPRESETQTLTYDDRALLSGVAFDRDGRNQACMGVAAGDPNHDGHLDLFVTNYYDDYNVLYMQDQHALFADDTRRSRLRQPSLLLLGFGTQFLDADLDGWQDLVVANGHVDDLRDEGLPFQMPAQCFRNLGDSRFVELTAEQAGSYFEKQYLGRGLARLDWNRDGREDFVVSNIGAPASLATNRTVDTGNWLAIRLSGVNGARDAIGAIVDVTLGDETRVLQLTAGDGFQASNQRQLVIGLGAHEQVDQLKITWPQGVEQTIDNVTANQELLVIEGREPVVVPK